METLKTLVVGKSTDKDTGHSYIDVYDQHFGPVKDTVRHVLELGVCHGGSLLLWHEYFQHAEITGVDISFAHSAPALRTTKRIRLVHADAYKRELVEKLGKDRKFDIIIDDGPHTLQSMEFVAAHYSALLAPKGILVIEDIQDIGWVEFIVKAFPPHLRPFVRVFDRRAVKQRYDDILVMLDLASQDQASF